MPPKMGRGRGTVAPATMDFVDSAIQEAIVSQRTVDQPNKAAYYNAVEGRDVLSNLYAQHADDVPKYEVASEDFYEPPHDSIEGADEMMMRAFAAAKR
mmetsp:Transcript_45382/g.139951  ORF Transcript_45382/g.139951 Transcript_45382/m.139951 type:complete len:98 (+) Transcript_45382:83-376(+)